MRTKGFTNARAFDQERNCQENSVDKHIRTKMSSAI